MTTLEFERSVQPDATARSPSPAPALFEHDPPMMSVPPQAQRATTPTASTLLTHAMATST
jgi:hypothetical protein